MRQKTRTIVAVTLLATALCADRAVAAAARTSPASAPAGVDARAAGSRTFAQRLTGSLRSVVPAVKLSPVRAEGAAPAAVVRDLSGGQTVAHAVVGDAFAFRLPPPLL